MGNKECLRDVASQWVCMGGQATVIGSGRHGRLPKEKMRREVGDSAQSYT